MSMPNENHQFRFRIPWITRGSSRESQPRRAKQKPPFRPPGIASAPPQSPSIPFYHRIMFRAYKNQQEKSVHRNMMFATSTPSEKDTKVVTTPAENQVTRNISLFNDEISDFTPEKASLDDKTISVVTLAGDNRGATMHAESSNSTRKKKGTKENQVENDEAGKAYVNSNIQSMNNSFMLHGSINGRDPGVRVILPEKSEEKPCLEKKKGEVKITNRAERPSYQTVVRRRCLRGLFMEPSDSDPDKPRRHGCKFTCGEVQKDHQ